jgi:hypothetical protein
MAEAQLTYATGAVMKDGDWVRIDSGNTVGRVSAVLNTLEQARGHQLDLRGIVVDAQPKGFVFLSEQYLCDDPPQLIRRGPGESVRFHLSMAIGFSVIFVLPALYSLFTAVCSAVTTGQVTVIGLGYNHTHRESVPWPAGWALFASPVLLLAALLTFDGSRGLTARWWASGVAAATGLLLLGQSAWFTTVGKAALFFGFVGFVTFAVLIDRRFGRGAAFLFMLACVLGVVWGFVRAT